MGRRKQGKLTLHLDDQLVDAVKSYADRQRTTVTALVESYFSKLIEDENLKRHIDAEQI